MKLQPSQSFLKPFPISTPCTTIQDRLSAMCFLASLLDQVNRESAARAAVDAGEGAPVNSIRVMLADDDCDDRELFADVISEISDAIQVIAVEDGLQLMKTLNEPNHALPAMIFLDLNMPGKSGKECLAEIKNNARFNEIPVVIYSTSANKKDIQETHGIGANLYVSKPNSFRGLIAVVAKVFSLDIETLKVTPPMNQFVLSSEDT